MIRFIEALVISMAVLTVLTMPAKSASYALLVGVSDYDESIGLADLRGPANDVALMRDVLSERGEFSIRILADGIEGAERPTRAAILSGLDSIVETAQSGDFVYIHMSGHGTQQSDQNGDETDGLDEVFLPADTARAEPGTNVIPNAILDEEMGERIAALRAKGADVWFVLDSCHSGSGLRAGSPRVASRFVDPSALGIVITPSSQNAATAAVEATGTPDMPGRFLAFYAAQSSEVAREILVDETDPNSWFGLFSSRLAARMQSNPGLSYRQLFQSVLSDLNGDAVPGAARLQTPLWEGNLIDAPVFGGSDTVGVRQFAVLGTQIRAGKLHGLKNNTVVALVNDAAAAADNLLGYAQIENAAARTASLAAVIGTCIPRTDSICARQGAISPDAKFARIVAQPISSSLGIAPPTDLSNGEALDSSDPLFLALTNAITTSNMENGTNIEIDPDGRVLSGSYEDMLWFGPKLAIGNTPVGLAWSRDSGDLSQLLLRISKAEELATMLENVAGTPSLLFPSPLKIKAQKLSADPTQLSPDLPDDLFAECAAALQSATEIQQMSLSTAHKQCDYLAFGAQGVVQGPARDVNRIYIDSQYCATAEYQRVEGVSTAAAIGEPMTICSECPVEEGVEAKAGAERMYFVVTESEPNREALNLQGLVETCIIDDGVTRSASTQQVDGFLRGLAEQDATRGGMGAIGISKIWVEEYKWQVLPREEALKQAGILANE